MSALLKSVPRMVVPSFIWTCRRSARTNLASFKSAVPKSTYQSVAPEKFAPSSFAPTNEAPLSFAKARSASSRSTF